MADDIESVVSRNTDRLLALPNVVAVGIGERGGKPVIKVFVTRKLAEDQLRPEEVVPHSLDGHEVDVEESGIVQAQDSGDGT